MHHILCVLSCKISATMLDNSNWNQVCVSASIEEFGSPSPLNGYFSGSSDLKRSLLRQKCCKSNYLRVELPVKDFQFFWNFCPYFGPSCLGDSDFVEIVMLVTLWWWLVWDVGDRIIMFVQIVGFFRYVGDFCNVLNRLPSSWIGHQHLKLVTNTFGV